MFGDKFNFGSLLKNAKKIQDMMEQAQEDLAKIEVFGESGAGAVKITMTARHQVKQVTFDDTILGESKEIVEDLVAAAINDAVYKVETITKSKMMDAGKMLGDISDDNDNKDK